MLLIVGVCLDGEGGSYLIDLVSLKLSANRVVDLKVGRRQSAPSPSLERNDESCWSIVSTASKIM